MEKLVSEIFLKKLKLSISQDQQPEHLCSLFLLYVQINDYLCQGDLKKKKKSALWMPYLIKDLNSSNSSKVSRIPLMQVKQNFTCKTSHRPVEKKI